MTEPLNHNLSMAAPKKAQGGNARMSILHSLAAIFETDVRVWHEPDHQRCPQFGR